MRPLSPVLGFDDAPFPRSHRGDVPIIGVICARTRLDGVISSVIRRDGANATRQMIAAVAGSRFHEAINAVVLGGIAVGGFNVVDIAALSDALSLPVLVVARKAPDLGKIRAALLALPGGKRKWALIEKAGPMELVRGVHVQRVGLSAEEAGALLEASTLVGAMPEPLRLAHIIAGGVTRGYSRGRA